MKNEERWSRGLISLLIICIILLVIMITCVKSVKAEPQNDTWKDNHWGGDTGEENYTEPSGDVRIPDNDLCTPSYCTGVIVMVAIPVAMVVQKRRKDIEKIQKNKSE